jgi:hypothetical protein
MNGTLLEISVDWLLIGRCLMAFLWGVLYATFLQHHRLGQFLADERTWVSVVIGVGVDLLLGIGALWWELWMVIGLSSVGVIVRSLINARSRPKLPSGYKILWGMEDAIALSAELIELLDELLEGEEGERVLVLSRALRKAHRINRLVRDARQGEYNGK